MLFLKRILNYYRDPGNARRLAHSLLLIPVALFQLFMTLRRTFWYTSVSGCPPQATVGLSAYFQLAVLCIGLAFWISLRGIKKAPWPVCLAEIAPAILIAAASCVVDALYQM